MRKILDRLSPRGLLLATLIASVLPFMLVELFPAQFYLVMDVPSYLVFHNITEFFSVMVSLSISAWAGMPTINPVTAMLCS